jgi:hypothetical protein
MNIIMNDRIELMEEDLLKYGGKSLLPEAEFRLTFIQTLAVQAQNTNKWRSTA